MVINNLTNTLFLKCVCARLYKRAENVRWECEHKTNATKNFTIKNVIIMQIEHKL